MYSIFPTTSKERAPVQNLIRKLNPEILKNQEIFLNGQLISGDIFKNLRKTIKESLVNFQVNKEGLLRKESIEVMLAAIDYYILKGCITELKSPKGITQELLLSKNLYDYLNKIKDILPKLPRPESIKIKSSTTNGRTKTLKLENGNTITIYPWLQQDEVIKQKHPNIKAGSLEMSKDRLKDENLTSPDRVRQIGLDRLAGDRRRPLAMNENRSETFKDKKNLLPDKNDQNDLNYFHFSVYQKMFNEYRKSNDIKNENDNKEFFDIMRPIISSMMVSINDPNEYNEDKLSENIYEQVVVSFSVNQLTSVELNFLYTIFTYLKNDQMKKQFQNFFDNCCLLALESVVPINQVEPTAPPLPNNLSLRQTSSVSQIRPVINKVRKNQVDLQTSNKNNASNASTGGSTFFTMKMNHFQEQDPLSSNQQQKKGR